MKKRLTALFIFMALFLAISITAFAESKYVVDDADLLTDNQESFLSSKLEGISNRQGIDVVAVTTEDTELLDTATYADVCAQRDEYGPDVVLLLIDMQSRKLYISTKGKCIAAFTDAGLNFILDEIMDYASASDYTSVIETFADDADEFMAQYNTGRPYDTDFLPGQDTKQANALDGFDWGKAALIAIVIGLLIALIITLVMRSTHKSVSYKTEAHDYMVPGSMVLTNSSDQFLYVHIDRTPIPKSNDSNNRGGFGGGGSSTHFTNGVQHGGMGRGF
ncbi:MAG: TPM domain-containing protein [Lachnospiraceae bacterium]|nr:TPM domain-containing protein [Lachnospiraceae bacterium]